MISVSWLSSWDRKMHWPRGLRSHTKPAWKQILNNPCSAIDNDAVHSCGVLTRHSALYWGYCISSREIGGSGLSGIIYIKELTQNNSAETILKTSLQPWNHSSQMIRAEIRSLGMSWRWKKVPHQFCQKQHLLHQLISASCPQFFY